MRAVAGLRSHTVTSQLTAPSQTGHNEYLIALHQVLKYVYNYEFAAIAMWWKFPVIDQVLYIINYTDNAVDI